MESRRNESKREMKKNLKDENEIGRMTGKWNDMHRVIGYKNHVIFFWIKNLLDFISVFFLSPPLPPRRKKK